MPSPLNEERVIESLDKLSPRGKQKALRKLIRGLRDLDRILDRNQGKLEQLCRQRGLDFARLAEKDKERLIDQILHED